MTRFSRRDFLKVAGATLASSFVAKTLGPLHTGASGQPNIILILCDSLSARHLSSYGYPRMTTPNIDALADRSTVFHAHYSGGNFTTTGTASMLTGMFGWRHRALGQGGFVKSEFVGSNPFSLLGPEYYRLAFSQNSWADRLVGQYHNDVDRFLSPASYSLFKEGPAAEAFENDRALASIVWDEFLLPSHGNLPGSLLSGYLNKSRQLRMSAQRQEPLTRYANGVPEILIEGYMVPYLNEAVFDGVHKELSHLASVGSPFFAYFHLFSPHTPYKPRADYLKLFRDEYRPVSKPLHPLSPGLGEDFVLARRAAYDRQVAQVDAEFGRLITRLSEQGILDDSYLIFTSDHGELFERGFVGHGFQFMYEAVLQVPLIIHAPRQTIRKDVFTPTSNADLLPTILSVVGKAATPPMDGQILPGFAETAEMERPIFSVFGVDNPSFQPLKKCVVVMRKGAYKLIAYFGYEKMEQDLELYNLENDPEELENLASREAAALGRMKEELLDARDEADRRFAEP